jgi:hypothetical protein
MPSGGIERQKFADFHADLPLGATLQLGRNNDERGATTWPVTQSGVM